MFGIIQLNFACRCYFIITVKPVFYGNNRLINGRRLFLTVRIIHRDRSCESTLSSILRYCNVSRQVVQLQSTSNPDYFLGHVQQNDIKMILHLDTVLQLKCDYELRRIYLRSYCIINTHSHKYCVGTYVGSQFYIYFYLHVEHKFKIHLNFSDYFLPFFLFQRRFQYSLNPSSNQMQDFSITLKIIKSRHTLRYSHVIFFRTYVFNINII